MTRQNSSHFVRRTERQRDAFVTRTLDGVRDLLPLAATRPERYPFLAESTARGTPQGRFDILFGFPGSTLSLSGEGALSLDGRRRQGTGFLDELDRWWGADRLELDSAALPFTGGWFLVLGYELAQEIEPTLELTMPPERVVAQATRIPAAIIVDHEIERTVLLAEAASPHLLEPMLEDLTDLGQREWVVTDDSPLDARVREDEPGEFITAVRRAKELITAGEVFQANLSRAWSAQLNGGLGIHELYARLRRSNPAPFSGFAKFGTAHVASSSPERLVRVRGGRVETRPIAGTRPRGRGRDSDNALSDELIAHPKERAEHVMLIDLERNDLGRVCCPGTVRVDEMMTLESYAHVHHIVSNVSGELLEDVSPGSVLRAVFPGGTITGCPKFRCMQIVSELEGVHRGPYTGSMGYLNRDGSLDLNILIRTLSVEQSVVTLRAGAGIVADSDPYSELTETRAKAKGMLLSLGCDGGD